MNVAPLVPHRDYSEAHLLYYWISLEPVYAHHGKFYSSILDKSMFGLLSKSRHASPKLIIVIPMHVVPLELHGD